MWVSMRPPPPMQTLASFVMSRAPLNRTTSPNSQDDGNAISDSWCYYLAESVHKVVLQKTIDAQTRQLVLYGYQYKEYVDGFVQ